MPIDIRTLTAAWRRVGGEREFCQTSQISYCKPVDQCEGNQNTNTQRGISEGRFAEFLVGVGPMRRLYLWEFRVIAIGLHAPCARKLSQCFF
jgi:hypothetical protein